MFEKISNECIRLIISVVLVACLTYINAIYRMSPELNSEFKEPCIRRERGSTYSGRGNDDVVG